MECLKAVYKSIHPLDRFLFLLNFYSVNPTFLPHSHAPHVHLARSLDTRCIFSTCLTLFFLFFRFLCFQTAKQCALHVPDDGITHHGATLPYSRYKSKWSASRPKCANAGADCAPLLGMRTTSRHTESVAFCISPAFFVARLRNVLECACLRCAKRLGDGALFASPWNSLCKVSGRVFLLRLAERTSNGDTWTTVAQM